MTGTRAPISSAAIDRLDRAAFVELIGPVFERSPWVAERTWDARPFTDVAGLHRALVATVQAAPTTRQIELIRAHPELAGDADDPPLTDASITEQASAGLDRLQGARRAQLRRATAAYRERFGFPFVICVSEHISDEILDEAERRLANDAAHEREAALAEIAKIAALRLREIVTDAKDDE